MFDDSNNKFDLVIIGGGINGAGVALDAVTRGLSVLLVEKNDFASGTSSSSSKLIHGGLRYLDNLEFSLVKEALQEREFLLNNAPSLVHSLKFYFPIKDSWFGYFKIRLGLWLYDWLAGSKKLSKSGVDRRISSSLKSDYTNKLYYFDATTQDARLVYSLIKKAEDLGAVCLNYTRLDNVNRSSDFENWIVELSSLYPCKNNYKVIAKNIVNAAGPWVDQLNELNKSIETDAHIRLIKGSHIVVPKFYEQSAAFILPDGKGRVVFTLPYLDDFILIGTTEVDHYGEPETAEISSEEIDYLLKTVDRYFKNSPNRYEVVDTFTGVRPITDHGSQSSRASREYKILVENRMPNWVSIYGGKLTSFRSVAEQVVDKFCKKPSLTNKTKIIQLPFTLNELSKKWTFIDMKTKTRWYKSYGEFFLQIWMK